MAGALIRWIPGSADRRLTAAFLLGVLTAAPAFAASAADAPPIRQQRYVMGTMFEIIVYHPVRQMAELAVRDAMAEIVRLDRVMSHYRDDSDLSQLNRSAHRGFVPVDPALYEVLERALAMSRLSAGRFDVTVGPLVQLWKRGYAEGKRPSSEEVAAAKGCVGYHHIEIRPPNSVRVLSDCLAIDLGGIGKGYAVQRALEILESREIRNALVNAGGSTIAAVGAPPGREGWPVQIEAPIDGRSTLLLRDAAISTSQQALTSLPLDNDGFGEIMDPAEGAPIQDRRSVSVVTANATDADALSTALLLMPIGEGRELLEQFPDASALWTEAGGKLQAEFHTSRLRLANPR